MTMLGELRGLVVCGVAMQGQPQAALRLACGLVGGLCLAAEAGHPSLGSSSKQGMLNESLQPSNLEDQNKLSHIPAGAPVFHLYSMQQLSIAFKASAAKTGIRGRQGWLKTEPLALWEAYGGWLGCLSRLVSIYCNVV